MIKNETTITKDGLEIHVTGGEISEQELDAYVRRAYETHKGHTLVAMDVRLDGDFVDLTYHVAPENFDRIRRITGYLVGDISKWNDAKRHELDARTMNEIDGRCGRHDTP